MAKSSRGADSQEDHQVGVFGLQTVVVGFSTTVLGLLAEAEDNCHLECVSGPREGSARQFTAAKHYLCSLLLTKVDV